MTIRTPFLVLVAGMTTDMFTVAALQATTVNAGPMQSQLAAPACSKATPTSSAASLYSRLVDEYYLPMAFLQAGVLASSADVATQLMERSTAPPAYPLSELLMPILLQLHLVQLPTPIVISHVFAMATVASTMSGVANAIWLRQLEKAFPGRASRAVVAKTLIHAVILASIINSAYLVGVPLLTGFFADGSLPPLAEPAAYFAGWTPSEFWTLTKLEICMFIPYNALAFQFVPPGVRPLTHAIVSATFNVAVSAVTLGCFDAWCERAVSMAAGGLA